MEDTVKLLNKVLQGKARELQRKAEATISEIEEERYTFAADVLLKCLEDILTDL